MRSATAPPQKKAEPCEQTGRAGCLLQVAVRMPEGLVYLKVARCGPRRDHADLIDANSKTLDVESMQLEKLPRLAHDHDAAFDSQDLHVADLERLSDAASPPPPAFVEAQAFRVDLASQTRRASDEDCNRCRCQRPACAWRGAEAQW